MVNDGNNSYWQFGVSVSIKKRQVIRNKMNCRFSQNELSFYDGFPEVKIMSKFFYSDMAIRLAACFVIVMLMIVLSFPKM